MSYTILIRFWKCLQTSKFFFYSLFIWVVSTLIKNSSSLSYLLVIPICFIWKLDPTWSLWCSCNSRSYSCARPFACLLMASTSVWDLCTATGTNSHFTTNYCFELNSFEIRGSDDSPSCVSFSWPASFSTSFLSCSFSAEVDFSSSRKAWGRVKKSIYKNVILLKEI